ncbi:CFI-box-CTERM domain-containing protein [Halococcus qingdaonensis]|uniref:CFI-box-CTERM domain-containing protein n=1 Tax=Halococcus qingdaonensis TaxID=224402 RepID=UPI0021169CC3|nr:CFI-box-CTERM domain-containing protein [Halococcus qingdaonensis]
MSDGDAEQAADSSADDTSPSDESTTADGSTAETGPTAVGDGRKKHVSVRTRSDEYHDHGDVYLKQSAAAFLVSPESSFPDGTTTRYAKDDLSRVAVTQHHSMCFITTATAGEGPALDALRGFRDDALARSIPGRALVATYDVMSPPIAATLARHPDARTTRLVAWLVRKCGALARRRTRASPVRRATLTGALVALYVVGVAVAAIGHFAIRLRERR